MRISEGLGILWRDIDMENGMLHVERQLTRYSSGRLSLHSLRHGYASLLIVHGLPLMFISRQLGHSKPSMTLNVYAHEFARRESGVAARQALEIAYTEVTAARR
jgi:integrase